MMRPVYILAAIGLTALTTTRIAQAGLTGSEVTYGYYFPFPLSIAIDFSLPTQTISPYTSLVDTVDGLTTTFSNNEIIITNNETGGFASVPFNGPGYLFTSLTITNVTIDPASGSDFLGMPSFMANEVMVNFEGLPAVPVGARFILDVTSSSAPVPEPASIVVLGTGLIGIGLIVRRRRFHAV